MSTIGDVWREYDGGNRYSAKQLAVSFAATRRLFEWKSLLRARAAGLRGRPYDEARHLCQAIRLLEGFSLSPSLERRHGKVLELAGARRSVTPALAENRLLRSFLASPAAARERQRYAQHGPEYAAAMKFPKAADDPRRQGNLVVLKPYAARSGEKGVLYLQYTESIASFVALFDLERLMHRYRLVLEPSTWGYQDENFLLLVGRELDVVVQAQDALDYRYIESLRCNLHPLALGAGDWIDPEGFTAGEAADKAYDFVMVASWSPVKRHAVFFRALAEAGLERARVALIGYPLEGRSREDIERLARRHGLKGVDLFERIPHAEVGAIVRRSRVGVMLSRREGANRGLYECLLCDVPVVVHRHNRGVDKRLVNEATGRLAADEELPGVLRGMLTAGARYSPRAWALAHTGYRHAWQCLDARLRDLAQGQGERYTSPIQIIKSAPAAAYVDEEAYRLAAPEYRVLRTLLRDATAR